MLRITPGTTQKYADSDSETPINGSLTTPICSLCLELLSDGYKQNYIRPSLFQRSTQPSKYPSEFKDKGFQSGQYPDQNPHFEKTCRFRLKENAEQDLKSENCTGDCNGKENGIAEKVCISCRGIDVEIDFQSSDNLYENEIGTLLLDYCFKIKAQEDYQFNVKNLKTNEETTYKKIIGEGSLCLEIPVIPFKYKYHSQNRRKDIPTSPKNIQIQTNTDTSTFYNDENVVSASSSKEELTSVYSDIRSNKEDSCETIEISSQQDKISVNSEVTSNKNLSCENIEIRPEELFKKASDISIPTSLPLGKLCSNCSGVIKEENIYYCLFGHDSCKQCKGKPCILCQKIMGETKAYCKNYHKGCVTFSTPDHLIKHETDCEFNNFRCPYPRCVFLNSLSDLKLHFLNSHNKSLIQSNNILEVLNGRKDRKWYIYCYENLFVCSYYYYGTHVEFILQYIGANDKAKYYQFEVEIKTMKEGKFAKKAICAGWNDLSLCKGIYFDYEDLATCDNSRFQFTASLKILNVNNGLYVSF